MDTIEFVRQEAKEEGLAEGQITVVKNLIATTEFSDERIASLVGVDVAFVKDVHQGNK